MERTWPGAAACRGQVPLHADGARLLEVAPYYGLPLPELCRLFDSLYVSFYKGLGGVTGAMLLGSPTVTREAAVWRRRLGGNPFTVAPYALSCRAAPVRARWGPKRQASARMTPDMVAIMPAALTAFSPPIQNGP